MSALSLPLDVASAHDYRVGSIQIGHPWALATPTGAPVGGGYMKITNEGTQPDRLIGLASPAASRVTMHETVKGGDVVRMRALEKGLEIQPGKTVELKPGGIHVMFEGLRGPLIEANRVKGTLVFEKAGTIEVEYAIQPMGTKPAPDDRHHGH